ncbi:hypothetical protein [Nonomuraea sp. NPDC049784]|uniref:hypothetical protein n=1 Tax=Nonomuraea sp. NPDC049784 TaxID=3154361 RepID=UPI0034080699
MSAKKHHQIPRTLLYSDHSALAVAAWCLYEALGTPDVLGGRQPARARRCWVADQLGVSERTLDRARTELLADHDGAGPFLVREIRGRNRSALHFALRRPQETRKPYAAVPAWSLARIHAGPGRLEGQVCPETWRAYAVLVDRLDPAGHDVTLAKLGVWWSCSATTARRRLRALEAVGWVRVRRRGGLWMHVQAITDEHLITIVSADEVPADGPGASATLDESPLPDLTTPPLPEASDRPLPNVTPPYGAPSEGAPSESSPSASANPLAVGDLQHRKGERWSALPRERPIIDGDKPGTASRRRPPGALSVMTAIPLPWQLDMSSGDRDRVLAAIEKEMAAGKTVTEMTLRIRRRLTTWAGRQPRRPVAAALTVIKRGYDCPRPDCENHLLPSGHPCGACAEIGLEVYQQRHAQTAGAPAAQADVSPTPPLSSPAQAAHPASPKMGPQEPDPECLRRGVALARRLLREGRQSASDHLSPVIRSA